MMTRTVNVTCDIDRSNNERLSNSIGIKLVECIILTLYYPKFEAQYRKILRFYVGNTDYNTSQNILSYLELCVESRIIYSDDENCQCDM